MLSHPLPSLQRLRFDAAASGALSLERLPQRLVRDNLGLALLYREVLLREEELDRFLLCFAALERVRLHEHFRLVERTERLRSSCYTVLRPAQLNLAARDQFHHKQSGVLRVRVRHGLVSLRFAASAYVAVSTLAISNMRYCILHMHACAYARLRACTLALVRLRLCACACKHLFLLLFAYNAVVACC